MQGWYNGKDVLAPTAISKRMRDVRHPLLTPRGCLMSNTVGFLLILTCTIVGGALGDALAGEDGALAGFVAGGVFAIFVPYRRWLLRWWEELSRRGE